VTKGRRESGAVDEQLALLSGWRYRAVLASVLLAAAGYVGAAIWSGWSEVVIAMRDVGVFGIGAALLLSLVNYGLRFTRWQLYLRAMDQFIAFRPSLRIYIAGFALTTTPGKVGEALRAVLLKGWHVPYERSLAALFSERLSDLLAVLILAMLGLSLRPDMQPMVLVGIGLLLAAFGLLLSHRFIRRLMEATQGPGRISRVLRPAVGALMEARRCNTPKLLAIASVLSIIAWAAEALAFHLILARMGVEIPLAYAFFVYALGMLAGALSLIPGGLGGAEAVMVALLVWKGSDPAQAIAATLIIRLATLWFAVLLGGIALSGSVLESTPRTGSKLR
jgi:uncharacterized protein (TIRG00374 family)